MYCNKSPAYATSWIWKDYLVVYANCTRGTLTLRHEVPYRGCVYWVSGHIDISGHVKACTIRYKVAWYYRFMACLCYIQTRMLYKQNCFRRLWVGFIWKTLYMESPLCVACGAKFWERALSWNIKSKLYV